MPWYKRTESVLFHSKFKLILLSTSVSHKIDCPPRLEFSKPGKRFYWLIKQRWLTLQAHGRASKYPWRSHATSRLYFSTEELHGLAFLNVNLSGGLSRCDVFIHAEMSILCIGQLPPSARKDWGPLNGMGLFQDFITSFKLLDSLLTTCLRARIRFSYAIILQ